MFQSIVYQTPIYIVPKSNPCFFGSETRLKRLRTLANKPVNTARGRPCLQCFQMPRFHGFLGGIWVTGAD